MHKLHEALRRLLANRSERGATATEYGLLASFIALAIVVGVELFGEALDAVYQGFATWITTNL